MANTNTNITSLLTEDQTPIVYYTSPIYPPIPLNINDLYVITTIGDRLDLLSQKYYNSTQYYWIISNANPDRINQGSLFLTPGIQIRIPQNLSQILDIFTSFNQTVI